MNPKSWLALPLKRLAVGICFAAILIVAVPQTGHTIGGSLGGTYEGEPSPFVAIEVIPGELFSVNARKCEYPEDVLGRDRFDCSSALTTGVRWIGRNHKILKTEGIIGRFRGSWSPSCPTVTTSLLVYVEKRQVYGPN
ncbi:hypothetical protein C4571_03865 [Candidatus Parcubacteria bacterium]|nr:MAG: hypothetical protein C4571_03865 [Candidatus Parcubacteria bacterium]